MAFRLTRILALVAALAAAALLVASGPGVRLDAWSYRTGLQLLRWSAYVGIAAAALSLLILAVPKARSRGAGLPVLALIVSIAAIAPPLELQRRARAVPPINDITTDTQDPPQYMSAARAYPGEEFARQQRAAYPDIAPLVRQLGPRAAFDMALRAAEAQGWEIVGSDAASGRIEALDTSKWFGFKDDVAIRISPAPGGGSRIDVRSKSRVGRSDLGTNARRIRAYLEQLK